MREDFAKDVGVLAADALKSAGLLDDKDFDRAAEIIEEELMVRLALEGHTDDAH